MTVSSTIANLVDRAYAALDDEQKARARALTYRFVFPHGYDLVEPFLFSPFRAIFKPIENAFAPETPEHPTFEMIREAAWKKYLNQPGSESIWKPSPFRPSHESNPSSTYFDAPAAVDRQRLLNEYFSMNGNGPPQELPALRSLGLGQYKIDAGKDERGPYISYYDKFDLDSVAPPLGATLDRTFGNPFEIYNRVYYDPSTNTLQGEK